MSAFSLLLNARNTIWWRARGVNELGVLGNLSFGTRDSGKGFVGGKGVVGEWFYQTSLEGREKY